MMQVLVRPAAEADARQMAELLNEIIEAGGTTALTRPMSTDDMKAKMFLNAERSAWHVATSEAGEMLGFQWIAPHQKLPPEACDIATFARKGKTGLGIGSKLFDATRQAAEDLGYDWINADIRSDNEGGLIYYQSRGFRDWNFVEGVEIGDGQVVNKVWKRFDLRDLPDR